MAQTSIWLQRSATLFGHWLAPKHTAENSGQSLKSSRPALGYPQEHHQRWESLSFCGWGQGVVSVVFWGTIQGCVGLIGGMKGLLEFSGWVIIHVCCRPCTGWYASWGRGFLEHIGLTVEYKPSPSGLFKLSLGCLGWELDLPGYFVWREQLKMSVKLIHCLPWICLDTSICSDLPDEEEHLQYWVGVYSPAELLGNGFLEAGKNSSWLQERLSHWRASYRLMEQVRLRVREDV